jgi:hypothetical protein
MSTLQDFKNKTDQLAGIQRFVVVARDGTLLLHSGQQNNRLGDYIAYIAITAEQLRPHLGFTGPYHMIMEQSSGSRIVALLGQQIIVGIDLDANISPAIVIDQLTPVVDQITL